MIQQLAEELANIDDIYKHIPMIRDDLSHLDINEKTTVDKNSPIKNLRRIQ